MSSIHENDVVCVGDYIVIQRQTYSKLHKVTKKCRVSLGKDEVELGGIVGKPMWTTYKMEMKSKKLFSLVECDGAESLREQLIKDISSGTDNRNIFDDGCSQLLSKEEIVGLRDSGMSGPQIVGQLIGNSKTFCNKTEYAQEKYLLKKEKKYFEYVTICRPTPRLVAQIMFRQDPAKIMWLRMDTLSQIITSVGIQPHGKYLLYDSGCLGLPAASMLYYLGEHGALVNTHPGIVPHKEAIQAMNFSDDHLSRILTVNIYKLLDKVLGNGQTRCQEASALSCGDLMESSDATDVSSSKEVKEENHEIVDGQAENHEDVSGGSAEDERSDAVDGRKRKLEAEGSRCGKRARWELELDRAADLLQVCKVDGLVVVTREHPVNVVASLLPLVAASRPVVVYCVVREPLLDLYVQLKTRGDVIGLRLSESWLRTHQVLPERTRPEMMMDGGGGYLLVGTTVEGKVTG